MSRTQASPGRSILTPCLLRVHSTPDIQPLVRFGVLQSQALKIFCNPLTLQDLIPIRSFREGPVFGSRPLYWNRG